jgi:hypothetical protein
MVIFLALATGVIQFVLAVFGAYMSLRRPQATPHVGWFVTFLVLGLFGIGITVAQAIRATNTQNELQATIEKVPRTIAKEFLNSGGNVATVKRKPWSLTAETTSIITTRMAPFADGTDREDLVGILYFDQDSVRLASEVQTAFRAAGWKIPVKGIGWVGKDPTVYRAGLFLLRHSAGDEPRGMRQLAGILDEAGISPTIVIDEDVPSDRFRILVGGRGD